MTEADLQKYFKKQCKVAGILFHKTAAISSRGFPDCTIVYKGKVVFVELKSPAGTGKLSPLQEITIRDLREAGANVEVIASVKAVNELIYSLTS